jgi:hypothetical protein
MDIDHFLSSSVYTLNDHVLSVNMYMLCINSYLEKDDDPKKDFMLSTILTPHDILKKFPKIFMVMCELDPIHDDHVRFIHKFMYFKKPIKR